MEFVPTRDGIGVPLPADADSDDLLLVRTRVGEDIARLLEALELPGSRAVSSPSADYPWRAFLAERVVEFLARETERLDYPNFKSRVQKRTGLARHDVYVDVWAATHGLSGGGESVASGPRLDL